MIKLTLRMTSYMATFKVNDNLIEMLVKMKDAFDLDWLP
jgi:hypothetical protein